MIRLANIDADLGISAGLCQPGYLHYRGSPLLTTVTIDFASG